MAKASPSRLPPRPQFENGAQWLASLGGVPLSRLAWIVDPVPRTVAVYTTPGGPSSIVPESGPLDGGGVLPGLSIRVADRFLNVPRA